jgi:prophage regulatory protein
MTTILRLPSVKERTGLSRSSIYAFVSQGSFPRPISLGARAVGWNSESVDAWIAGRIEQSQLNGQSRVTKKAEVVVPAVREDANTSIAPATESRRTDTIRGHSLNLRRGLALGRSQIEGR